ncbi:hypothetical protein LZ480_06000 [Solibacillus sp. MA9]|uniref:Transglutaminase-like domain-containing protein n=1 Tax=Solibacillus palustris TaxID=2908203 RepID=A0ABS9UAT3_9BACL|nr:transglutaminase domain-containing protein [Solibacillus sp. MA9]MCH7321442.1 hypothetical protein [Solibacillus sp. MA9]
MENIVIFSILFLVVLWLWLKLNRAYFLQRYIRKQLTRGIRNNKQEIRLAKGDKEQQFEVYKRVYNHAIVTSKKRHKRNQVKYECQVNNELNRMVNNPLTRLFSSLLLLVKGITALVTLFFTIVIGSIVVDEVKASDLTLPTINKETQIKLKNDASDVIDQLFTNFIDPNRGIATLAYDEVANSKIVPVYSESAYPEGVETVEQLAQATAYHMANFEQHFTIPYKGETADFGATIDEVYKWLEVNEPYYWGVFAESSSRYIDYGSVIEWQVDMSYDLTAEENAQVNGKIKQLTDSIPTTASEIEKIKFVNDYLVKHTKYTADSTANPHTPFSILMNGEGVCEGYALAALLMLEALDVEVKYVVGDAGAPHAWNLVKVEGEWYHLDTTWNDPLPDQGEKVHYNYFLLSDETMAQDHTWIRDDYPATATSNYW